MIKNAALFLLFLACYSTIAQQKVYFTDSLCNISKTEIPKIISGEYLLKVSCDTLYLVSSRKMQQFKIQNQLYQMASKRQDITGNLLNNYETTLRKNEVYYENLYAQYKLLDQSSTAFSSFTKQNLQQASDTLLKVSKAIHTASGQIDGIEKAVKVEIANAKKERWKYGVVGILIGGLVTSTTILVAK